MGILCKVLRGGYVESIHVVYAVAVDEKGDIIQNWGDPNYLTCIRSSLKPFQASASVAAGATSQAGFTDKELALMCASHNGEKIHVRTAQGMLEKLGYDVSYYECGSHPPYDKDSKFDLIRKAKKPTPLYNNCSGKHAGMLSLSKYLDKNPEGYTEPDHPVQKEIMKQVRRFSELDNFPLAVDGCSAPVPILPLYNIALMYQKLAQGNIKALSTLYDCMAMNHYLVAGSNRFDTDFIEAMHGRAITKVGGEAVRGIAIRKENGEAIGVAMKVLDGNQRCAPPAAMAILESLDLVTNDDSKKLGKYSNITLKNHRGLEVGSIEIEC